MRVVVDDAKSVVEVWLMKSESDNPVKDIIKEYALQKYIVAVFRSGTQNLESCTAALLASNI